MSARRIALLLEYDGAAFSGSQLQLHARTVQAELEHAIEAFGGQPVRCAFAGRTDSGVHARGQVVAFDLERSAGLPTILRTLNYHLPKDVAARAVAETDESFNPRGDAIVRRYRYRLLAGRARSPLERARAWHRERPLDLDAMHAALALLPRGETRDWSAFAGRLEEGVTPERSLDDASIRALDDGVFEVDMQARSFLPHQVRRTVGALVDVGRGARTSEEFGALIDGQPCSAGPAAPPHGLTLEAVIYPEGTLRWYGQQAAQAETVRADDMNHQTTAAAGVIGGAG